MTDTPSDPSPYLMPVEHPGLRPCPNMISPDDLWAYTCMRPARPHGPLVTQEPCSTFLREFLLCLSLVPIRMKSVAPRIAMASPAKTGQPA
jgi:hypothetical protein